MASGRVSIRLNNAGISRVTNERLMRVARAVGVSSARRVNVDTGLLRSTRSVQNVGPKVARVAYRARYAKAVHDGSRPHIIRAANGGLLANKATGQVFGTVVHHPGYKGNPYLTGALREVLARYSRRARG